MIYSEEVALQAVTLAGALPYAGPSRGSRDEGSGAFSISAPYVPATVRPKSREDFPATTQEEPSSRMDAASELPSIESYLVDESPSMQSFDDGDEWAFEDACIATAQLSERMATRPIVLQLTAQRSSENALPMWTDDEMDDTSRVAEVTAHVEAAAQLFDSIASRVRSGELQIPSNVVQLGEAATLAAALAALLGGRG